MNPAVLPLALCVLGVIAEGSESSFKVFMEPEVPMVEYGGSLTLKLKTTCQDPAARGNFETSLRKQLGPSGPRETEVHLLNVTEWNASVQGFYNCYRDRSVVTARITIYRAPELVVLEPVPALVVGKSQEVSCRVAGAAPMRNLVVTLRRDGETLSTETFPQHEELAEVRASHQLTARRQDHGHNLTCQALLDLAPHGPRLSVTSDPQTLTVYEFPEDLELEPDIYLEVGKKVNATCAVRNAFPAPRFQMALANRTLPLSVSRDGHQATAEVAHSQPGDFGLVCTVSVGPVERRKEAAVHVYRFPSPQLNLSTHSLEAGKEVRGHCLLPPGHSAEFRLQIRLGHRVLEPWGLSPLLFSLTMREEDHGEELSCDAQLLLGSKAPRKTVAIRLSLTDHDPNLLLLVAVPLVLVALLVAGGVGYGIYYRKKKIRQYRLQQRQKQLQMEQLRPPGSSEETAALNGSALEAQP